MKPLDCWLWSARLAENFAAMEYSMRMSIHVPGAGYVPIRVFGRLPPEGSDVWWRADDKRYANYDPFAEFEQPSGSHLVIELTPFLCTRHTPRGVFVSRPLFGETFVLGTATRQLAVPTKELAIRDLIARKKVHAHFAAARAKRAATHLRAAEAALEELLRQDGVMAL